MALGVFGLRALYFCLAGLLERFVYLHYGLAFLLAVAGVKLILSETPVGKLPVWLTLGIIVATLAVSVVASLRATRRGRGTTHRDPHHLPGVAALGQTGVPKTTTEAE